MDSSAAARWRAMFSQHLCNLQIDQQVIDITLGGSLRQAETPSKVNSVQKNKLGAEWQKFVESPMHFLFESDEFKDVPRKHIQEI